ncbi:hypothetical protein [uncultured Winogradskyella sp.]|uniref:hypothetical protein n=1 Tax=uncultured Winogradskyella sp. TaxID=395353 RepID=UPI0030D7EACC|tara:strand:+ start:19382 stop:19801 length:420 start_codon:yes stop_codon:yes gene_type:complete
MKFIIYFVCGVITIPFIYSQNLDEKKYSFSTIKLESKIVFEFKLDSVNTAFKNDDPFSFSDINQTNFKLNSEELNTKLFSNFKLIENTYIDYTVYLRGCGPLEDGITNSVNSGDLMLSMVIDNFVNNVFFKGKGVFFKK